MEIWYRPDELRIQLPEAPAMGDQESFSVADIRQNLLLKPHIVSFRRQQLLGESPIRQFAFVSYLWRPVCYCIDNHGFSISNPRKYRLLCVVRGEIARNVRLFPSQPLQVFNAVARIGKLCRRPGTIVAAIEHQDHNRRMVYITDKRGRRKIQIERMVGMGSEHRRVIGMHRELEALPKLSNGRDHPDADSLTFRFAV